MNQRNVVKAFAYGRRWRILFAAIVFPSPLVLSSIHAAVFNDWAFSSVLSLTAILGIYGSLIAFLAAPIACWWAFRMALGIIGIYAATWTVREILALRNAEPVAPPYISIAMLLIGSLCVFGTFRPRPDPVEEQKHIDRSIKQSFWLVLFIALPLLWMTVRTFL